MTISLFSLGQKGQAGKGQGQASAPERAEQTYVLLDKLTKHRYTKAEIPGCAH